MVRTSRRVQKTDNRGSTERVTAFFHFVFLYVFVVRIVILIVRCYIYIYIFVIVSAALLY